MSDDEALLALLGAVRDGDEADEPMDSDSLGARLGWSPTDVASRLTTARAQMLIWGARVGGNPGPKFVDLELTVQGRRFIAAAAATGDG
ncbi:MAG: hypothetical protein ACR2HQ_10900 [Ilumatobacteraceae bacterium]